MQGDSNDVVPVLRPLNLDDFIQSKAKVSSIKCVKYVTLVRYLQGSKWLYLIAPNG